MWALQGVFALLRCDWLGIVRAHATWRVRAASASGHALVRIIHRARGLLHRVVRFRLAHCHHVSAYGDNVGGGWHAQRVDNACASRAAEVASALQSAFAPDVPAASRPTVSQWPKPQASHPAFDVSACCCVSACARRWRGSHAGSVCVERAVHACARVQGAGQRVCVRHARRRLGKPGARHASCRILPAGKKGKIS